MKEFGGKKKKLKKMKQRVELEVGEGTKSIREKNRIIKNKKKKRSHQVRMMMKQKLLLKSKNSPKIKWKLRMTIGIFYNKV